MLKSVVKKNKYYKFTELLLLHNYECYSKEYNTNLLIERNKNTQIQSLIILFSVFLF